MRMIVHLFHRQGKEAFAESQQGRNRRPKRQRQCRKYVRQREVLEHDTL